MTMLKWRLIWAIEIVKVNVLVTIILTIFQTRWSCALVNRSMVWSTQETHGIMPALRGLPLFCLGHHGQRLHLPLYFKSPESINDLSRRKREEKNIKDIVTSPDQVHHHQWSILKDDWLSRSDRYGTGRTTTFLTVNLLTPVKHKAFCGVSYNNVSIHVLYLFVFVCLFIKCLWTGLDFIKYCLNHSRIFSLKWKRYKDSPWIWP